MIRQDDILLKALSDHPLAEYGCALFSVIYFAIMEGSYIFTRESFLKDVDNWVKAGVLDSEMTVLNWDRLAKEAGLSYTLVIEKKTHKLPKERKLKEDELQILYLNNPDTGFHHFVVGTENDDVGFDPLGNSVTAQAYKDGIGYIESKRIFKRKK